MGRNPKFSKEEKIEACEKYIKGYDSFDSIANEIGCHSEVFRQWYLKYTIHGPSAFDHSNRNRHYTKEFKLSVVSLYLSGKYSYPDLGAKYNIVYSTIRKWVNKYYNGIELNNYDPKGEVYTMKSQKTKFEERLKIVKWVVSNDMNYKEAASKFAINYANVYKWTKSYLKDGAEALKYKKRGPKSKTSVDESSLTEIEKLKLELERERTLRKRKEFELEVLKKKEEFEKKNRYRK